MPDARTRNTRLKSARAKELLKRQYRKVGRLLTALHLYVFWTPSHYEENLFFFFGGFKRSKTCGHKLCSSKARVQFSKFHKWRQMWLWRFRRNWRKLKICFSKSRKMFGPVWAIFLSAQEAIRKVFYSDVDSKKENVRNSRWGIFWPFGLSKRTFF